jgi:hypothetical protein
VEGAGDAGVEVEVEVLVAPDEPDGTLANLRATKDQL